jgi:hypothetical protein
MVSGRIFFLTPDQWFTENSGIFVELFVHKDQDEINRILGESFMVPTMRLVSNHEPVAIRTYRFKEMIRKQNPKVIPNFYLSMRYGFWECQNRQSLIIIKALR